MPLLFKTMLDLLMAMCATFMSTNPSQMKRFELARFIIDASGPDRRRVLLSRYADDVEISEFALHTIGEWVDAIGSVLESMDRDDSELTYTTRDLRDVFNTLRVDPGPNFDGPVQDAPAVDPVTPIHPINQTALESLKEKLKTHVDNVLRAYKTAHNALDDRFTGFLETRYKAIVKLTTDLMHQLNGHARRVTKLEAETAHKTKALETAQFLVKETVCDNKRRVTVLETEKVEMKKDLDNHANLITELQMKVMPPAPRAPRKIQNGPAYFGRHPTVTRPTNPQVGGIVKPKRKKPAAVRTESSGKVLPRGWVKITRTTPKGRVYHLYESPRDEHGGVILFNSLVTAKKEALRRVRRN